MNDDAILLRHFVEESSEAAFTELVQRHLDLVYGAALRRTGGDAHRAADVAQEVFTALARQARQLSRHAVLSAWLHTATRNIAVNFMISEQRRKAREQVAVALQPTVETLVAPDWDEVRPVLDAAIDELPEPDRVAVVLRFLECRPFAEIGAVLHLSTDAARMRTERALDKLRTALARRGITSTAAALGALVSTHSGVSAPAGLATTLAPTAFGAAAVGAATLGPVSAFLVSTKTIVSVASIVAALGLGFYLGLTRSISEPLPPLAATPQHVETIAALRKDISGLRAEIDRLNAVHAALVQTSSPATAPRVAATPSAEKPAVPDLTVLKQQRAMLNNLRMIWSALDEFYRDNKRAPTSLDELVGPTKYLRQLNPVAGESYAGLALVSNQPLTVTTPAGIAVTFDPAGKATTDLTAASKQEQEMALRALMDRFGAEFFQRISVAREKAIAAFRAAHGGDYPSTPEAALPYFATSQEGADFVEFSEAAKALGIFVGPGAQTTSGK